MEGNPRYKFYLDGTLLTTEPSGWDNIRYFVKYDRELKGLTFFIDANLSFKGDGYETLKNKLYSEGFCSSTLLKILEKCSDGNYKKVYEGLIKGSKIEIDERDCAVSVKPDDNSYFAKIDKARKQKALLYVGTSKNGAEIDAATIAKGEFFNPADGVYYPVLAGAGQEYSCSVFSVYEAFKFLVAFMTDGEVEFDSSYFGPGGEQEGLIITSGRVLFTVQTGLSETAFKEEWPEISFDELFKEVDKKKNLGFYMDYSGAKPKMFIEKEQDIPNGVDIVTLDAIDQIKTKILTDRLYNIIKVGSTETLDVLSLSFPESVALIGFKEEQYNTAGDCTEDKELNLVSDWIISSNVIEDAVVNGSDEHEGEIFLIYSTLDEGTGNYVANRDNHFSAAPPYYYNQSLTNATAIIAHLGAIPTSIIKYLGIGDDLFLATRDPFTSGLISTLLGPGISNEPVQFNDDFTPPGFDQNNRWGNGTPQGNQVSKVNSRFTAPFTGVYGFQVVIGLVFPSPAANLTVSIVRYDSANTLISSESVTKTYTDFDPVANETFELPIFLDATDYIQVAIVFGPSLSIDDLTQPITLELVSAPDVQLGIPQDPRFYFGLLHTFEFPINRSQFDLIRNNPRGNIAFGQANQNLRRSAINEIQFNPDGTSSVRLVTSIAEIPPNVTQLPQKG